jgi:uncharacterized RDD family membrane protein YckC
VSGRALVVRLPEGVEFALPLAGPLSRFLALAVDLAAISLAVSVVTTLLAVVQVVSLDLFAALAGLAYFALSIGYGIVCEWRLRGQTLGKRLMGLRVVDAGGLRLRPHQVVTRNLLRAVDALPIFYLVGGACALLSPRLQRLGDLAAGTVVVRARPEKLPDLEQWLAGRFNSLAAYPHLAARLRQAVTPEEARLALAALLRRDELDPSARLELFAELAELLRERVPFPEEAWTGLPDEQYVRNVVDLLFRPASGRT